MSRMRKDKNCLNCGHQVEEIYCPHCGQKNAETHVNAFHAIAEFIGDYFHADGKFLKSILPLLFRPGYMTNEYNTGRREKYVHPFRLYIFVSIVYFSIAYISGDSDDKIKNNITKSKSPAEFKLRNDGFISIQEKDSLEFGGDSTDQAFQKTVEKLPGSIKEYRDSVKMLPSGEQPSFKDDVVNRVAIKLKTTGDADKLMEITIEKFKHTLPKLLFFLLPLAALLLKIFYIRRKRFYIDHLVHTLHLHSFIFLLLIIYSLIHFFAGSEAIFSIAVLLMIAYFFTSMKTVYGQSLRTTVLKGIVFSFCYLICLAFIFGTGFLYIFIYD